MNVKTFASDCIVGIALKSPYVQSQGLPIAGTSQSNNYKARVNPRKSHHLGDGNCKKVIDSCLRVNRKLECNKRKIRSHDVIIHLGSETTCKSTVKHRSRYSPPHAKACFDKRAWWLRDQRIRYQMVNWNTRDILPKNFSYSTLYCVVSQNNQKINKYNKTITTKSYFLIIEQIVFLTYLLYLPILRMI